MSEQFIKLHLSTLQYEDLTLLEKVILEEIRALHQLNECHISNGKLSQDLRITRSWICKSIKNLEKKGYIRIEYPSKTRRILTPTIVDNAIVENTIVDNAIVENTSDCSRKCNSTIVENTSNYCRNYTLLDKYKINNRLISDKQAGGDDENQEYWKIRNEYENKFGLIVGKGGGEKLKKLKELFDIFEHELLLEVIQGIREPGNIKNPFPYIEKIAREENAKRIEAKKKKEQADIEAKLNYVYTAEDGISLYKLDINGERQYID
jgi:DNA-binding Lrp family transcriptional regulator